MKRWLIFFLFPFALFWHKSGFLDDNSRIFPFRNIFHIRLLLAIFLFLSLFPLFANDAVRQDQCSCGIIAYDCDYAAAISLLCNSINGQYFSGSEERYFPSIASAFYPRKDPDCNGYSYEGRIRWSQIKRIDWPYAEKTPPATVYRSKSKIGNEASREEFNFHKNYGAVAKAFNCLRSDVVLCYESTLRFIDARREDIAQNVPVYEWGGICRRLATQKTLLECEQYETSYFEKLLRDIDKNEVEAFKRCAQSLEFCAKNHHQPSAYVNRGFFYYLEGDLPEALAQLEAALNTLENNNFAKLKEEALFLKGQAEVEAGLYADAVICLSDLISRNRENRDAYFERAIAYFELGNFDSSLTDYLAAQIKQSPVDTIDMIPFSLGLTVGVVQGSIDAGAEFVPNVLACVQGINHGLWALAADPVKISQEFVQSLQDCVRFVREQAAQETLLILVPELKELVENWEHKGERERGSDLGYVIGKYGVDIFISAGSIKAMQSFRALKRANNLLTLEAMAISKENRALIQLEAAKRARIRKEILSKGNLQIQTDKQGKHIVGHKNYEPLTNRSILEHTNPQNLIDSYAGKGIKVGNTTPGVPGYKEIVNFEEVIGFYVDPDTNEKTITNWGTIHYAKDGVHIVPTKSR